MADTVPIKPNVVAKYAIGQPDEKRNRSIGCKVTERERRLLETLVIDAKIKGLPFKTSSDIVYWCFKKGIAVIAEDVKTERFTNLFRQLHAEENLLRLSQTRREWQNSFKLLEREVEIYDQEGMTGSVPKLLRDFEENLKGTDDQNPWVLKVGREFYAKYGHRLKADRVSNSPRNAVKDEE